MERSNLRLKRLTNRLSCILNQIAADLEKIGPSSDRFNTLKQQFQASMQELTNIERQMDDEAADRQRIEDALEASREELKDFIYMTSHDFREPLRKIASFGAILKESLEGKMEQEDLESLKFMIDGAERMTQMIEHLLAYSRINTRTIAIEKVDLNDILDQLEKLDLQQLLEDTGAYIEVPQPLPHVQADPTLVRQLVRNLIIHAIQYRKEDVHPHIVIRTERLTEGEIKIECEDNGVGIEIKNEKDMFKLSLHPPSRQAYEEAGTGLAVCKKIVEKHGGRIGIESTSDAGSTVWFTWPVSKGSQPEQSERLVNATISPNES